MMSRLCLIALLGLLAPFSGIAAPTTYYGDRASFLEAVGAVVTDDYSSYGATPGTAVELTNVQMNAVLGETKYQPVSFPDRNLVTDYIYRTGDYGYCAGCNGNFILLFDQTSLSVGDAVYAVALDFVLHTSRMTSIGDTYPGQVSLPGTIRIDFRNGDYDLVTVPADVGFFGPELFFLGLTDNRGIQSITIGTEALAVRHFWIIDNLTIGARQIPEPATLFILGLGLAGLAFIRRGKQ